MKLLIAFLLIVLGSLTGCAHKELDAPCGPNAARTGDGNPCDIKPINVADLGTWEITS